MRASHHIWPAGVEPAISGARSRWGVQLPYSQMSDRSAPPAGLEPAASGLRARRHRRFDHGGVQLRRQGSNLPLASNSRASYRLDHAGTKEAEAAGLEPANGSHRLRASNALPCQLGHASRRRKERDSNPASALCTPPVFETGHRAGGSPSASGPGRRRTCNPPLKRRQLCQLSYGAVM